MQALRKKVRTSVTDENHHHRWTEKIGIGGQKCLGDFTKHEKFAGKYIVLSFSANMVATG